MTQIRAELDALGELSSAVRGWIHYCWTPAIKERPF